MSDDVDQSELAAAQRLDDEISAILAGQPAAGSDPVALWLGTTMRPAPTRTVRQRVARIGRARELRALRFAQLVAGSLAALFLVHGVSGYFAGEWIARNLGESFSAHVSFEAALAFTAIAGVMAAGALWRRWLPVSVASGAPLGVLLGAHGIREITVFPFGAALHVAEGVLAIVMAVAFWRLLRYRRKRRRQEQT